MGVVVDSSVLITLERADTTIEKALGTYRDPCISSVVVSELLAGVLLADSPARAQARQGFVDDVLASLPVIGFNVPDAREHARLSVELRRNGTPVGERDPLIAATAIANGHSVMTANTREFERVPGLHVTPPPNHQEEPE